MTAGRPAGAGERRWLLTSLQIVAVALVYVLGARIGLQLAFENRNVTAFWPPTGIAVAALVAFGRRVWPGVAVGAFVANLANGAGAGTAAAITVGNTLAPLLAVELMRVARFRRSLERPLDVLALFLGGGVIAMTVSATAGTAALALTDAIGNGTTRSVWVVWWVGDAIGVALFAPLLLLATSREHLRPLLRRPIEANLLLLVTGAATAAAFNVKVLLPYVAFLPILWATVRFDQIGAAATTVVVSAIAVAATANGQGPFSFQSSTEDLISLQAFNATVAFASLLLAAVLEERKRAERALRSSEELHRKLFEEAHDFVCIHDAAGRITYANRAAERLTGYSHERLITMAVTDLVAPESLRVARRMTLRQLSSEQEPATYEIDILSTSGRRISLEVSTTPVYAGGEPTHMQMIGRDISTRNLATEHLRRHVLHDDLTGLPGETLFVDRTSYAMVRARVDGSKVALLLIDADGSNTEDVAHIASNASLKRVGATITVAARETDVVARLGRDQFAILLAPVADVEEATATAERLLHALDPGGKIGIALAPSSASDARELLRNADIALHVAQGSNAGYAVYGPHIDPEAVRTLALEQDLPDAFATSNFEVLFQPKIVVTQLDMASVECTARWEHPRLGTIAPADLRRMTERAGLGATLATWTIREALVRTKTWLESGLVQTVGVNVGADDLLHASFIDDVQAALDGSGVAPDKLLLEVSEHHVTSQAVVAELNRLTDMGVGVCVDHFGTGYSSLVHLRGLSISELKIDAAFVQNLARNPEDRAIARSIIKLAHDMDVPVVADGIQTRETWAHLVQLGCDLAQGSLICEPVVADELQSWMKTPAWSNRVS